MKEFLASLMAGVVGEIFCFQLHNMARGFNGMWMAGPTYPKPKKLKATNLNPNLEPRTNSFQDEATEKLKPTHVDL